MNVFPLHDYVLNAISKVIEEETENLSVARNGDFGEYRYRIGRIAGLRDAIEIAEETRKKIMES